MAIEKEFTCTGRFQKCIAEGKFQQMVAFGSMK
jgi:hypothetical protein